MMYVRSLFGRPHKRFLAEVRRSLNLMGDPYQQWARKRVRYYTTGRRNTEFLWSLGARHVEELSPNPFGLAHRGDKWLNHWRMIRYMVEQHGEILHTDFDCWPTRLFDEKRVAKILRSHHGLGQWLQAPVVRYRNPTFFTRNVMGEGWEATSKRLALNVSFFYCAHPPVMQLIEDAHLELAKRSGRLLTTEHSLIYCLEKHLGRLEVQDLYRNFEPEIVYLRRSPLKQLGVEKGEVMFEHA